MQKKAFLIIFFFILAFFVGGLTGLAAAYFVTGSGTKAVPAQVQPTSESGPSFLEEASFGPARKESLPPAEKPYLILLPP